MTQLADALLPLTTPAGVADLPRFRSISAVSSRPRPPIVRVWGPLSARLGNDSLRLRAVLVVAFCVAVVGVGSAWALDTVSESDIIALFANPGATTPVLTSHSHVHIAEDNHGAIGSAAYDLGNGLFLYAYDIFCEDAVTFTVSLVTVPLSGSVPLATGAVTSGTFWTGRGPFGFRPYSGPFSFFDPLMFFPVDAATDPITAANVAPGSVTFVAPGVFSISNGLPVGVFLTTPLFRFIPTPPPTV